MVSRYELQGTWHKHFGVPILHHAGFGGLDFGGPGAAIHEIRNVHGCRSLAFYADLRSGTSSENHAGELVVSLHGAATGAVRYPQFRRVRSLSGKSSALLSFADPTLQYSDENDFRIGWYVGGKDWDPLIDIARVVRAAQLKLRAEHVMFVGSSAGGHAALRIAAQFPGSLAFVMDPQTDVGKYYAPARDRVLRHGWPASDVAETLRTFPTRFDLLQLYARDPATNFVYYRQSTGDGWHERVHARPFEAALRAPDRTIPDRFRFIFEPGVEEGHGKITAAEFNHHYSESVSFWRRLR